MKPLLIGNCPDCGGGPLETPEGCASCNQARRRAEKASNKVKVVHQVKKVSAKRAKEKPIYDKLREEQLKEHPECQIKISGICTTVATECHHAAKRGINYLNKETFLSACEPCHKHTERVMSAKERREKGLLITPPKQTI
jgi:hypothetical protein